MQSRTLHHNNSLESALTYGLQTSVSTNMHWITEQRELIDGYREGLRKRSEGKQEIHSIEVNFNLHQILPVTQYKLKHCSITARDPCLVLLLLPALTLFISLALYRPPLTIFQTAGMKQQNLEPPHWQRFIFSTTNQTTNVVRRLHGVAKETQRHYYTHYQSNNQNP